MSLTATLYWKINKYITDVLGSKMPFLFCSGLVNIISFGT